MDLQSKIQNATLKQLLIAAAIIALLFVAYQNRTVIASKLDL